LEKLCLALCRSRFEFIVLRAFAPLREKILIGPADKCSDREYLSQRRKGAKFGRKALCHFDPFDKAQDKLREKSFLDPSHSFGMTGTARHLAP